MIATVDKNEDWKISYSEFRVLIEKDQNFNCSTLFPKEQQNGQDT